MLRRIVPSVDHDVPLTEAEVSSIDCPTPILCGVTTLVTLDRTVGLDRAFPDSRHAVVPGLSQLLLHEQPTACRAAADDVLASAAVTRFMLIGRADPSPS